MRKRTFLGAVSTVLIAITLLATSWVMVFASNNCKSNENMCMTICENPGECTDFCYSSIYAKSCGDAYVFVLYTDPTTGEPLGVEVYNEAGIFYDSFDSYTYPF